jgi:hypothetical protein
LAVLAALKAACANTFAALACAYEENAYTFTVFAKVSTAVVLIVTDVTSDFVENNEEIYSICTAYALSTFTLIIFAHA